VDESGMIRTSASSRPSDSKWKKDLKQPELEREVKDCDFSYFSDLECESESKSDTSAMIQGGKWLVLEMQGLKVMVLQQTSTRPKIHLTVENIPKDYFRLFLTENLVQGFVDETNTYANNSIVSKHLSPRSI
jgi:hypothetical protein